MIASKHDYVKIPGGATSVPKYDRGTTLVSNYKYAVVVTARKKSGTFVGRGMPHFPPVVPLTIERERQAALKLQHCIVVDQEENVKCHLLCAVEHIC